MRRGMPCLIELQLRFERQRRAEQQPEGSLIQHIRRKRHDAKDHQTQCNQLAGRIGMAATQFHEQCVYGRGRERYEPDNPKLREQPYGSRVNQEWLIGLKYNQLSSESAQTGPQQWVLQKKLQASENGHQSPFGIGGGYDGGRHNAGKGGIKQ